jgi:hypothetical protein
MPPKYETLIVCTRYVPNISYRDKTICSEYIDILTLGLNGHRVNVVAHVAHTTAMFGLNTFHYIDP